MVVFQAMPRVAGAQERLRRSSIRRRRDWGQRSSPAEKGRRPAPCHSVGLWGRLLKRLRKAVRGTRSRRAESRSPSRARLATPRTWDEPCTADGRPRDSVGPSRFSESRVGSESHGNERESATWTSKVVEPDGRGQHLDKSSSDAQNPVPRPTGRQPGPLPRVLTRGKTQSAPGRGLRKPVWNPIRLRPPATDGLVAVQAAQVPLHNSLPRISLAGGSYG